MEVLNTVHRQLAAGLIIACFSCHCSVQAKMTKDDYYTDGNGYLNFVGVDQTNPIWYDNDIEDDVALGPYLYAKASLGEIELVGLSATPIGRDGNYISSAWDQFIVSYNLLASSGICMERIPPVLMGASQPFGRPGSGNIWDTQYYTSDASNGLVAAAQNATLEKPLLVLTGGQMNTVATAVLQTDGSISDNMFVFSLGMDHSHNDGQRWPAHVVAKTVRCFALGGGYGWYWPLNRGYCDWQYQPNCNEWSQIPNSVPLLSDNHEDGLKWMWLNHYDYNGSSIQADMLGDCAALEVFMPGAITVWDQWMYNYDSRYQDNGAYEFDVLGNSAAPRVQPIHDECLRVWTDMDAYDGQCPVSLEPPTIIGLTAISAYEVLVEWQDNSTPQIPAEGFVIERRPYGGVDEWYEVGSVSAGTSNFTDTDNLHGNVVYTYRVGAVKN